MIDPSIPSEWDGFKVERSFRGCCLTIRVENPDHVQHGVKELYVNGKQMSFPDKVVLTADLFRSSEEAQIRVVMKDP